MNTTKEEKKKHKILIKVKVHGSRQHSTCSFMPACLLRTLVDTNVLLLCTLQLCSGPTEGRSALLAVRRYGGFQCSVCAFVVCAEEEAGSKTKLRGCSSYSEAVANTELIQL